MKNKNADPSKSAFKRQRQETELFECGAVFDWDVIGRIFRTKCPAFKTRD